jgi:hypothetical protein
MHNPRLEMKSTRILLLAIFFAMVIFSCRKETEPGIGPSIEFKVDTGYVYNDDTVLIGKTFNVGIIAKKGDVNITNFIIKVSNDSLTTYLDTGVNTASLSVYKTIIKGLAPKDTWTFIVRDKDGNSTSLSFNIYADANSTFGPVITIPSIILGAQNNTATGSFLDIKNVAVYNLQQAFGIQDSIEILYYYDAIASDANTIASPNANIDVSVFPGTYGLSNWTIKNETRYLITAMTDSDFNNFSNDSLLIALYDEPNSKRKAKNLIPGNIYVFKTAKGKLGLFEVLNVSGTDTGTIEIKVKMQPY